MSGKLLFFPLLATAIQITPPLRIIGPPPPDPGDIKAFAIIKFYGLLKQLNVPPDLEGDSQMSPVTESSQGESSDAMFPAANDAPSDLHTSTSNQQAGELSPPYSQDQPDANGDEAMDLTGGGGSAWESSSQTMNAGDVGGKREAASTGKSLHVPGQSWDNIKARDEYQRQWNGLLDKNFSLKRFGDPFDGEQT